MNWENHYATWYPLEKVETDNIDIPVHFGVMYIMENYTPELIDAMQDFIKRKAG